MRNAAERFFWTWPGHPPEPPTKRGIMKKLAQLVLATGLLLTTACAASAQGLTAAQARAAIAPWYSLFNQPVEGDMKTLQEQVLTADYEFLLGLSAG